MNITLDQILTPEKNIERLAYLPYSMEIAINYFRILGERQIGKDFIINKSNEFVIQNLIRWAHGDKMECLHPETKAIIEGDLTKGIYIAGPTGTGKTILLQTLSRYLEIDDVKFRNHQGVKSLIYPNFTTIKAAMYYAEFGDLYPFLQKPVICFHDLGVEPQESMYMGSRLKVMQTIIQERGDMRGVITLFTSNNPISDPETEKLYGDRGISRLKKMCNYFELTGEDFRAK